MSSDPKQKTDPSQPKINQIRIEGHLDDQWTDLFSGLSFTLEENGDTLLTGPVADQAALFGLLIEEGARSGTAPGLAQSRWRPQI